MYHSLFTILTLTQNERFCHERFDFCFVFNSNSVLALITKSLIPITTPTSCYIIQHVLDSAGVYLKSLCVDNYGRTYSESRLNCLKQGMRIYRADSKEATAAVLDVAYKNWTLQKISVRLHISANASGPLFVSNINPSWKSELIRGNSSAFRRSVCEYIDCNMKS